MKAGTFSMSDYIDRLYEAAEAKEKEVEEKEAKTDKAKSGKVGKAAPVTKAVGGAGEGLIIPEENKKVFGWLKKEYEKGKTEVKVEINMADSKFKPGYDLQTNLKSVKDFKPGMFGDVKTSDTEGSKKKEDGTGSTVAAPGANKNPKQGFVDTAPDKNGEEEVPKKKFGKKGEAKVSDVDVEEKDKEDVEKDGEEGEEKKEKFPKEDKFKKKLKESVNEDLGFGRDEEDPLRKMDIGTKGYRIIYEGEPIKDREAYTYLMELPMTHKPNIDELNYVKKLQVDPQLEEIIGFLPIVNFNTYENMLGNWGEDFPFMKTPFVCNVEEDDGVSFLIRPEGYDYARYIAELI